jgi:DNA topoisomerase-1
MGIGRPSTYAPTISTIQKRDYVEKEFREGTERAYRVITLIGGTITPQSKTEITGAEKGKLFPTNTAMVVTDFLVEHFPNVTNFSFTADVEKEFDEIAQGAKEWNKMIDTFYKDFHSKVEITSEIDRKNIDTSRELGVDPKTGKKVIVRLGRFGPLAQLGETPEEEDGEKPTFASLRKGQFIERITLEEALELFKLPRTLGEYEDYKVTAAIGRFGPYIKFNNLFISIPKGEDPLDISMDRAIELIEIKKEVEANKYIKTWDENPDIQVLNGRYGPYIKAGKKNVKIPKDKVPAELTLEECVELAEKAPEKKARGRKK